MNTTSETKTIANCFADVSIANANLPAIVAADVSVNYAKLWRIIRGFAVRMQEIGINSHSMVAVHSTDMIACVAAMLATSLLGARHISFGQSLLTDLLIRPTHYLRSPEVSPAPGIKYHLMNETWPLAAGADQSVDAKTFPQRVDIDEPWFYVQTSGTTGSPKFLSLSQRIVYRRSMAVKSDFRSQETRLCSLFPCNTRPFFARANAALLNACTIVDTVDISFMQAHGVNLVCAAPRTAVQWLAGRRICPKIQILQVSGAKLSDKDAAFLLESFESVEDVYGASETNKSFVNVNTLQDGSVAKRGKLLDSEVEIVDNYKVAISKAGTPGAVRIRNDYMASAYIDAEEASKKSFQGGWFYPGDRATWGPSGELLVAGRADDIVNLDGEKVDLAAVDAALCTVKGISAAATFREPSDLVPPRLMSMVMISVDEVEADVVAIAHTVCSKTFGPLIAPRIILVVPSIPMTADGAPRRNECEMQARLFIGVSEQLADLR